MRKPRLRIGVLTRNRYQLMSEEDRRPYEYLAAEHGYWMSDLHHMEVRKKSVLFWVFDRDSEGLIKRLEPQIKEYPR